jgi:hypothetical protein
MTVIARPEIDAAVARLIAFLETGAVSEGLFAPDCFTDLSLPQWRIQATSADDVIAIRAERHPFPGRVRVERVDRTVDGFVLQVEERWLHEGQKWYCREQIRADVVGDSIVDLAIYCTGDWDEATQREHASAVRLVRF